MPKRFVTAEDLYKFKQITDFDLSPDGERIVYALQWIDRQEEKRYTNLWLVNSSGRIEPHRFTVGEQSDGHPRWSPDGAQIAFLSNRHDERNPQIFLIPAAGGEARQLTSLKGIIHTFRWSPDGKRLLVEFTPYTDEEWQRISDEEARKRGIVYRHITRPFYKHDGSGFLPQQRRHLWLVDVRNGKGTPLTEGPYDEYDAQWSPDGRRIVFLSNRTDDPDLHPDHEELYLITVDGSELEQIPGIAPHPKSSPTFSPDGRWIAYIGGKEAGQWWRNPRLWLVPIDGSAPARDLTGESDMEVGADVINDLKGAMTTTPPTWSLDGRSIYVQISHHGRSMLYRVGVDDGALEPIIDERGVVGKFVFDSRQQRMAYFFATMRDPGQLYLRDIRTGRSRKRTRTNSALLSRIELGEIEEVWFKGWAGNDLQGWIIKPPNFDPGRRYPSIMEIHGGPLTQYGEFFMHEFFYLAAQGYVVYFCNPRGGRGYGEAHAKAIWEDWGNADYTDLMAWADYVEQRPYIDPARMGVTGGSYGGYMTLWIIGHTDRFEAAVAQRVVSNFISMWGSSDMNWVFQQVWGDKPPWEAFETYWEHSPLSHLGKATTPTRIIHSENDLRCPIEQGEQAFIALRVRGIPTDMILFPDEPHGLSRTGRTDRRVARLRHILEWMERYLKTEAESQ